MNVLERQRIRNEASDLVGRIVKQDGMRVFLAALPAVGAELAATGRHDPLGYFITRYEDYLRGLLTLEQAMLCLCAECRVPVAIVRVTKCVGTGLLLRWICYCWSCRWSRWTSGETAVPIAIALRPRRRLWRAVRRALVNILSKFR